MKLALAVIFDFKFIFFGYSLIILNIDNICIYFVEALSKNSMIGDKKYFN